MNPARRRLADQLYAVSMEHDRAHADRLERFRNVEPPTAELLGVLIRAAGARRVLELGTSNGYSTIWLADAAQAIDGSVTSVEIDPERSAQARENLRSAGLEQFVELRVQDAADALATSQGHSWEFIFLDAERPAYPDYWPHLRRALAPRGLLVVDNVISHAEEVADFRALITADATVTEALVPTGAGALLVVTGDAAKSN